MIGGSCHCGAVRISVPAAPEWAAQCNCSLCAKLGWLVAYYPRDEVTIEGATEPYLTGDKWIEFRRCPACGITIHWQAAPGHEARELSDEDRAFLTGRLGVNARLIDGFAVSAAGPVFADRPLELRFYENAGL